jgi:methionyl-tRNA formyltransferase
MKISILITSKEHPVSPYINKWAKENSKDNQIDIVYSVQDLIVGDILFLISCSSIVSETDRSKFNKTLVIHASDLPTGRGWSPHVWEIINGATEVTLSLLEVEDKVDTGDIWKKIKINIPKTALYDEINQLIFNAELNLMSFAVSNCENVKPNRQLEADVSYWPKRLPRDSEVDINKGLDEQFDLIRVCDPDRFPAFFYKDGKRFNITIKKIDE